MRFINCCIILFSFNCFAGDNLESLDENEGYVILPLVISGMLPKSITLEEASVFGNSYKVKDIKIGENFELITLPAGDYKWTKIQINKSYYFNLEEYGYDIKVNKGVVNYGGHLIIDFNAQFGTARYNYVNRSSQVIKELESCCDNLMSKYSLYFTANSEDPFIDFLKSTKVGGRE
ncbi:hypothetical protein [Shewanella woodyi]|uniref:Uncharacterized protein n=1 Tax=Shewanella woodyi (strain ATCC 51908 / MS32) TaxID=392500 RepID=B1KIM2_SHEWM|nr:hypothetical protein [Shewanella woodyi]ACA88518.1 hypothetical protein Swoo_4262 [Shewanella woodyi ATCC 51908]